MKQLFITSDAFVALNNPSNPEYKSASDFITSLFGKTVKLYSSIIEIACAAEQISTTVGVEKAHRFVDLLLNNGGIIILADNSVVRDDIHSFDKTDASFKNYLMVRTMRANGIKDAFSFNSSLKKFNIIVWPKR